MMTFKRLRYILLLVVCLLPVSSIVAHAENVDIPPYQILQTNHLGYETSGMIAYDNLGTFTFTPHNSVVERDFKILNDTYNLGQLRNGYHRTAFLYKFISTDSTESILMLEPNTKYKVNMKNIYHSIFLDHIGYQHYARNPKLDEIAVIYDDLSSESLDLEYELNHTPNTPYVDISFSLTVERPVQYIYVSFISEFNDSLPSYFWDLDPGFPSITTYFGEYGDGDELNLFTLEIESEEVGLLKSLIEWVKGIKSKVDDTFESVSSGFSNVVTNITNGFSNVVTNISNVVTRIIELPQILWDKISEGLKALFIPNEQDMAKYKDKWDLLLSQRFGALYQVGDFINEVADNTILNGGAGVPLGSSPQIHIPLVSLDKFGIPFSFGGYYVDIIPEEFERYVIYVERIISIACTLLFVNALRKRYESVVGG